VLCPAVQSVLRTKLVGVGETSLNVGIAVYA
jgi:hypothetical protein